VALQVIHYCADCKQYTCLHHRSIPCMKPCYWCYEALFHRLQDECDCGCRVPLAAGAAGAAAAAAAVVGPLNKCVAAPVR
jgi:hypothetical protein